MLKEQLRRPSGLIGRLVGLFLAHENDERIEWAIQQLRIRPEDRVLEIGFGPGDCIEEVAALASCGYVAGVEVSDVMIEQAHSRNATAIEAGRVDLRKGDVCDLPFEAAQFDKVFTINSINIWDDEQQGLQEIRRVLCEHGTIAIIEHPPSHITERAEIRERGEAIVQAVKQAGFRAVRPVYGDLDQGLAVCVHARK